MRFGTRRQPNMAGATRRGRGLSGGVGGGAVGWDRDRTRHARKLLDYFARLTCVSSTSLLPPCYQSDSLAASGCG